MVLTASVPHILIKNYSGSTYFTHIDKKTDSESKRATHIDRKLVLAESVTHIGGKVKVYETETSTSQNVLNIPASR